jgi:hypothetical protein
LFHFWGLFRSTGMQIPSAAMRAANGLRRTFALRKSTSGISRRAERDGSLAFSWVAFVTPHPSFNGPAVDTLSSGSSGLKTRPLGSLG